MLEGVLEIVDVGLLLGVYWFSGGLGVCRSNHGIGWDLMCSSSRWVVATRWIAIVRVVVGGGRLSNRWVSISLLACSWLIEVHLKVIVSDVWLYRGLSLSKSYCILLFGLLSLWLFITYNLLLLI